SQPIARLSDADRMAELAKTRAEIEEEQARLDLLRAGPRTQEIAIARTALDKATERLKYGRSQLEMDRALAAQQLLPRRDVERTEEEATVREKELHEAKMRLDELLAGSRREEIEAAMASLRRLVAERAHLEDQLRALTVVSPVAGIVTTHLPKEIVD